MIVSLPRGYDTILGSRFGDGHDLSTEEWQKIAFVWVFYRNARIIILEEPTSSLDARAEYEFFKAFREKLNRRTAIIIRHRFSTVRMVDCIFVMDGGRVR